ncbi:MAG TPA: ion channel [Planctomycetaceae bacterium]|nr:ion channel [Planctomycetaceae bacterium]
MRPSATRKREEGDSEYGREAASSEEKILASCHRSTAKLETDFDASGIHCRGSVRLAEHLFLRPEASYDFTPIHDAFPDSHPLTPGRGARPGDGLLNYMTVGDGDVLPATSWRLLGPIEAAVGVLMLGWSSAIIVAAVQRIYNSRSASSELGATNLR